MGVYTIKENEYPKLLKKIKGAPKQLHYKGKWDLEIFENCLAVVGSRRMTMYGKQVVERIVGEAAAAGVTIVSGFMYGVDAASHKAALRVGGRTIAVMPCGIDLIHPEYQGDLYNEILGNNGLVVSEYEGDTQPALWTYPQRNRIVAGLSKAVLIIEAGEKSGSLITASWAKKFKRKIFAVPGPITSANSKGTLQLIKEGAELATSAKDILVYFKSLGFRTPLTLYPADTGSLHVSRSPESELEKKIVEQLQREPLGADELSRFLEVPVSELGVTLSMMQLRALIYQEGSKYYVG